MAEGNALIAALRAASGNGAPAPADQSQPGFQTFQFPWQSNAQAGGVQPMPSFAAPTPAPSTAPTIAALRNQRLTDAAKQSDLIQQTRNQQNYGPFPDYYNRDTDSWEPNTNAYVGPNTVEPWYPADMIRDMPPGVALPPPMRTDTPTWGQYNGEWQWAYPDEMAALSQSATQQPAAPEAPSYQPPAPEPQYQEVYDRDVDAWVPSYQGVPQQQYAAPEQPSYQPPAPEPYMPPEQPSYQAPVQQEQQQPQEYSEGPIWGYNEREGQWMWYDPNDNGQVYR